MLHSLSLSCMLLLLWRLPPLSTFLLGAYTLSFFPSSCAFLTLGTPHHDSVKRKFPAQKVMPEFIDAINHTEGLSLRGGVVLFHVREPSAGVIHGPIPSRGCTLHKGASDGNV